MACALALGLPGPAMAEAAPAADSALTSLRTTPTTWRLTSETWDLPGSERMGMVGANLMFDVNDTVRVGMGSYGAVRGDRGGFITLGVAGELRQRLGASWRGHAGLFVGAGGGRNGVELAGGGLMLRSDLGLVYETAGHGNVGVGLSHVSFPSGRTRSTQPYVLYEYTFQSLLGPRGLVLPTHGEDGSAAAPSRAQEFSLVTRSYRIPSSVLRDNGQAQHGSMQLLGVEWLSYQGDRWFVKLESEGAMGGDSAGYMQILAGGGYRWPVGNSSAVKLHAAAGPAGGGGVDTGGGLLLDAGVAWQQQLSRRTALELGLGELRAPSGSFKAHSLALKLNHQFGLPAVGSGGTVTWPSLAGFDAAPLRVRVASQTYVDGSANWRSGDQGQKVSNLGVQLDYFVSPHWFLTGQGLAAYEGDAGAYMAGQLGVGAQWPLSRRWFMEGEALVGAAGGGGLATGNGLVGQVNASLGYRLSQSLSVMATAGHISALKGDMKAKVLGVSLGYEFTGLMGR